MKRLVPSDAVCLAAAAVLLYMTALAAMGTTRSDYQVWSGVFTSLICLLPMLFRHSGVLSLPLPFIMLIEVAIFLHGYGVLLMKYDDLVWYDTVTHTVSTLAVALCVFYALMAVELLDLHTSFTPRWIPLFIALIMMTFSIYWEVFELVVDMIWATNMQYSPWDTIRDMASNTVGTLAVTVSARLYLRDHTCREFIDGLELHPALERVIAHRQPTGEGRPGESAPESAAGSPPEM